MWFVWLVLRLRTSSSHIWSSYLRSSASDETGGGSEEGSEAGDGATGVDCVGVEVSQMPV